MFISERDESDNILNGQRARGAQTTRSTCKKNLKKNYTSFVLVTFFGGKNISTTFPHAFLKSIFLNTINYTRVIKLCISYCDEDS